ncbi:hypothetical protein NUACC21_60610 [Scytonema sp. NUACC21]
MSNISNNNQDLRSHDEQIAFTNHRQAKNVETVARESVSANNNGKKPSLNEKRALLAQLLQQKTSESKSVSSLSCGQQALWFLYQLAPESPAYNIMYAARVRSDLDILVLQRAFGELIERHPALRTGYTVQDGSAVQQIHPHQKVDIEVIDASTLSHEQLNERLAQEADRPFDLESGAVLRVNLFTTREGEYVLLLTVHHIASDFWSLEVLINELCLLYFIEKAGVLASLPSLTLQYTDYVRWQSQMLAGSEGERLWSYWQKQLSGVLSVLDLPTDRPRPPVQTYRGASHSFKLNEELTQNLAELAKAEGATLFMSLLAAFQVLLYRYTNQEDILVGSPTTGRSRNEFAGIVGYFANPVVLRANLSQNPSFKEFLSQVRSTVLGAIAHQDYPFPLLVERLCPKRDPSFSPLVQVMFIWDKPHQRNEQNKTVAGNNQEKLELEPFASQQKGSAFDLTLTIFETDKRLSASLQYNTDLFEAATIARMAEHFQTLLKGIVANPEQRLSDLPMMTPPELQQLLVAWNDTQALYPQDVCIHQLFEAQVERTPDAVAAVFEDRQMTYSELNCRANCLAHYLQKLGIGPDSLVGLCLERSAACSSASLSLEMLVGLLGILKAGGAYLPLDPSYPQERLTFMLEDARVSVLLTQQQLANNFVKHQAHAVALDVDWEKIARESQKNPSSNVTSQHLAYVIYTSGSTGKPKGVQVLHGAVVNFLTSMSLSPGLTDRDTLLSVTTLSFDIAVLELFLPLMVGARVVVVSREAASDGTQLLERLTQSNTTVMQATPTTWRLLLAAGWQGNHQLKILCGGEALPRELANQLLETGASLWNMYGPTETTIWSAICRVDNSSQLVPIGRPIANTQIYLLDRHLQPVPVGIPGELYIGGAGLARGYLNRPELTGEKFIPNPFSHDPKERLYKTGDLVRYLPDGNIEYIRRIDSQTKLRGFRIELGEIETLLSKHPSVRQAVVLIQENIPGNKRLVAYVTLNQEQAFISNELRNFLKEQLPQYMVPSTFVTLDTLPLTPNGKVDRKALPNPESLSSELAEAYVGPQTEVEQAIAAVWQEALSIEKVGMHDNFFDLGGHSLLMAQVHKKLQEVFKRDFLMTEMFKYPTISSLVEYLSSKQGEQTPLQQSQKRLEMRKKSMERRKNATPSKSIY